MNVPCILPMNTRIHLQRLLYVGRKFRLLRFAEEMNNDFMAVFILYGFSLMFVANLKVFASVISNGKWTPKYVRYVKSPTLRTSLICPDLPNGKIHRNVSLIIVVWNRVRNIFTSHFRLYYNFVCITYSCIYNHRRKAINDGNLISLGISYVNE